MSSPHARVECEIGQQVTSSPRKCAIGKPSLRLSIPNVQNHGADSAKNQKRFASNYINNYIQNQKNQNHNGGSFVRRMVENCNSQGQFGSNEKIKCDTECEPSKSDIKIIVNNSNYDNKSSSDFEPVWNATASTVTKDKIGKNETHDGISSTNRKSINDTNNSKSNILQLPSYSAFESDFRKKIDEMNTSSRLDLHMKGI